MAFDALSVCGKNPDWATDINRYFTFGGEMKIAKRSECDILERCQAVFKKQLDTKKFMVANTNLKLPEDYRIILRIFDHNDPSRGVMLPGMNIFVNDDHFEFSKKQAKNLLHGEIDMTSAVAKLGKFTLEVHWCALDTVKNDTYGWGIYIAYPSHLKVESSSSESDDEDYILTAPKASSPPRKSRKKSYSSRSPKYQRKRAPSSSSGSDSSSSAELIRSPPHKSFKGARRVQLKYDNGSDLSGRDRSSYKANGNYQSRSRTRSRSPMQKSVRAQVTSYEDEYRQAEIDQKREVRQQIDMYLNMLTKPNLAAKDREDIQNFLREKSKETVRIFFDEVLRNHHYEEYAADKQKSHIIGDMFADPDFAMEDKRHMASRILRDEQAIKDVIQKQFSKNVFVKIIKYCADDKLAKDVFMALRDEFKFMCMDKIGNYAIQDILKEGTRMGAGRYVDVLFEIIKTDVTKFKSICSNTGGSHVVQCLIDLMSDSKLSTMTELVCGKENGHSNLITDLLLDTGSGFFVVEKLINVLPESEVDDICDVILKDESFAKTVLKQGKTGTRFTNLMKRVAEKVSREYYESYKDILSKVC